MIAKFSQRYQKSRYASLQRGLAGAGAALFAGLALLSGGAAQAQASLPASESVDPLRQRLVQLREAVDKKQWQRVPGLVPPAQSDPVLGDYAPYWLLRWQTQDPAQPVPTQALQRYIQTSGNGLLVERLMSDWIVAAARAGDYATALRLGPIPAGGAQVQCATLLSRHMTGQPVAAADALAVFQPGQACWTMLDQFADSKVVSRADLSDQLRGILETNRPANAQRMAAILFDAKDMVSYAALIKNPKQWLAGRPAPTTWAETELVTLALSRLARDDRDEAANLIQNRWAKAIPPENLQWVWGQFGLVAALNVDPKAHLWYRKSGSAPMTDYNHAWQVRAELRKPSIDWKWVETAVRRMSPAQQAETAWAYWLGRALAAQGNAQAAQQQFAAIRGVFDFYGQLASEELGSIQPLPPAPSPVTAPELQDARVNPGLQRAIALFDLGWRTEAVQEWAYALRGMTDRELRAAAEFARQEQIFDRVINTSLQTSGEVDFSQRFIAPFEGRVSEKAREIGLDPAWVYGLIRQESRFITDARSRVGASGLMQLMPATAKWVAGKIGMKNFRQSSVNDFDTNTILGTRYLDMVLRDLDGSQVLASAGYNAGPGRPVRWRAALSGPVEGAIFAETIPFTETRLYVKHVLSNATYYATLFTGEPQSLKERLGTIAPRPARKVNLP